MQHLPWSNVTLLVPHSYSDSDSDSVAVSAANLTNFAFRPEQTILLELSSLVHDAIRLLVCCAQDTLPDSDFTEDLIDLMVPSSSPFSFSRVSFLLSAIVSLLFRTLVSD